MNLSNYTTNKLIDGRWRGGALTSAGAAGSSAVVNKGIWAATTAYSVGDVVVPHANMTGAGGKFLRCTTAGTSGSTNTLAVPNPGSTLVDGGVTWTAVSGIPCELAHYVALFTINKGLRANSTAYAFGDCISLTPTGGANGDTNQHLYRCTTAGTSAAAQPGTYLGVDGEAITDGSAVFTELSPVLKTGTGFPSGLAEVSGGAYARVKIEAGAYPALTDFAATQGGSTASTGTTAATSNSNAVTYPTSTAAWGTVGAYGIYDQLTGGNLTDFGVLSVPQIIGASGNTPSFAGGVLTIKQDN
ncbi:MAG: hypothetical protein JSR67_03745 [Proteobacteria bacterium]|nr:hypothetical protein [Pseudomonadota bacterium]